MRTITNERGVEVIAIGEWNSPARMQQKYPDTIAKLNAFVITGYKFDYQILKELAIDFGVIDSDIHNLLSAVHFYTTDLFKNEVYANQ
jgi:hypothetical protein